eukprot:Gb_13836 [translate_table: standard]
MGKTSRWFRSLLGGKKEPKQAPPAPKDNSAKEKRRWSFGKSSKDRSLIEEQRPSYRENYISEVDKEQNKHAIAVAAATAAAADAAVAAAQAAVAVVRLTSNGRASLHGGREKWAAIRIQTVFRGYLARRALRALKGLVKLQALVRGYLVRKQADATLCCMQALVRVQARVRGRRFRVSEEGQAVQRQLKQIQQHEARPRKSVEGWKAGVDNVSNVQSRRGFAYVLPQQDMERNLDESAKIVEIDTCRPKASSKRRNSSISDSGSAEPSISSTVSAGHYPLSNFALQSSSSLQTEGSIPVMIALPTRLSIPSPASDGVSTSALQDFSPLTLNGEWEFHGEEYKFSTAQSSPQFCSATSKSGLKKTGPFTPTKSEYAESFFQGYSAFPNYMANTQSSRAKVRSQSAPKQRPDPSDKSAFSLRKRMTLHEAVENRASFSGVRMQRSCSQAQAASTAYHQAGSIRLDRSIMSFRDSESDSFHSQW